MNDDEVRIAAVRRILRERDDLLIKRLEIRRRVNAVLAEDRALERKLEDLRAAGRVFGQGVAIPRGVDAFNDRQSLDAAMLELRKGRKWVPGESEPTPIESSGKADENDDGDADAAPTAESQRGTIRDLVLTFVQEHKTGVKADDIKKWLAFQYAIETHDKTVGMTLYRLSKEGLVRRQGHTWFPVTVTTESENPGADTPGQTSSDDKKGGTDGD